jgi:hypothetical protein
MMDETTYQIARWQPLMVIVDDRLECRCGALAIFATGIKTKDQTSENCLESVNFWCQECYRKAQEEND